MQPPETVWGYESVTAAYAEKPAEFWKRIMDHVRDHFPGNHEKGIIKLIGKKPHE